MAAYGATLWSLFVGIEGGLRIHELPALSGGMMALLGISHAGYLGHKAVSGLWMSRPEIRSHANEIGLKQSVLSRPVETWTIAKKSTCDPGRG